MAKSTSKTPGMFDPEALLAIQRRNFEAFTSAGQIVAEGMRTCAERQTAMMQEAMHNLWSELKTAGQTPAAAGPSDQLARIRAAFDQVLAQVQEMSQLLFKVQSEAMTVLNTSASASMETLGGTAPDLAGLQRMATEAMQTASRQVSAAVDETRKRMAEVQAETQQAVSASKESMVGLQPEQEDANLSVAGEEDPFVALDDEEPKTLGKRKKKLRFL